MIKVNRIKIKVITIGLILSFFLIGGYKLYNMEKAGLDIKAKSAILVDFNTGKVIYKKNENKILAPASMTKIMTEYLVLNAIHHHDLSWETPVKISHYAYVISSTPGFSHVPLIEGKSYSVKELYDAMAIHSANGATIALAESVSKNEAHFVKLMNQTAKKFGMSRTKYVNSTGLSNKDLGHFYSVGDAESINLTTAIDLAILTDQLIQKYPEVLHVSEQAVETFEALSSKSKSYKIYNTNLMLSDRKATTLSYEGVDGLKTGYTSDAGYCFTGTAKREGDRFITVVMGAKTESARFTETKKLLDFGFEYTIQKDSK